MAELNKPEYQTKRMPGSRRAVYNVQPARSQAPGPDPTAGDVTLSTANIFSKIQDSLEVFSEIYAQSEKTANVLQAKGLLIDKMKDTQRIKNLISTDLKYTPYQNLKLKDVLDKYQSIDGQGKTDLNIGEGLSHNISPLRMPDDLSDEVKNLVEEQWIQMDIGIMNDLIGQVNEIQSAQTLELMKQSEERYKGKVLNTYLSIKDEEKADIEAQILQDNEDAEAERLSILGTWGQSEVRDQKLRNGQIRLTGKFMSDYLNTEGDPQENRDNALKSALSGKYKYKDKEGNEITLNPNAWEPYLLTEMKRSFTEQITEIKNNEVKSENLMLKKYVHRIWRMSGPGSEGGKDKTGSTFNFADEVKAMVMNPSFKHIEPAVFYQVIFNEEVSRLRRQEAIQKEKDRKLYTEGKQDERDKEAEIKATMLADLTNKMTIIGMEFEHNPEKAKAKYGKKNKDGRWVGKDDEVLQNMEGIKNKYARSHYISSFIARANSLKTQEIKAENNEIIKAQETEVFRKLKSKATADLLGASIILYTFGHQVVLKDGTKRWELDYRKLGGMNTEGGRQLIPYGVGTNGGLADRTNRQIQTIQAQLIYPIFDLARDQLKIFMKIDEKEKEGWSQADIHNWKDRIADTYAKNIETRMRYGEGHEEGATDASGNMISVQQRTYDEAIGNYPKGKPPPDDVQVFFNALRDTLERTSMIAEKYDEYKLEDLVTHKKNLLSATNVPAPFKQQHLNMIKRIIPLFDKRMDQLRLHPVEIGFKEGNVVRENGTYDIEAYYKWQEKFGVEDMSNLVFKSTLKNIENVAKQPNVEQAGQFMVGTFLELNKYGAIDGTHRLMAFEQMMESFPFGWKLIFKKMYDTGELPNMILVEAEWLKANNPDYGKNRVPIRQ